MFHFSICPRQTGPEKVWFGYTFRYRITNFKPQFISPQKFQIKKFQCPSARGLPEDFKTHHTQTWTRAWQLSLVIIIITFFYVKAFQINDGMKGVFEWVPVLVNEGSLKIQYFRLNDMSMKHHPDMVDMLVTLLLLHTYTTETKLITNMLWLLGKPSN